MRLLFFLLVASLSSAQQIQYVDFKTCQGNIAINPLEKKVSGSVKYTFSVIRETDSVAIDARNMTFENVELDGRKTTFYNSQKQLVLRRKFAKGNYTLAFTYEAHPRQTMYFNGDFACSNCSNQQVWTQGQGKFTSHWFPSLDDMNDKVIFSMNISFDKKYQVLANGVLMHEYPDKDNVIWQYRMQKPMSSYLLAIAAGNFVHKTIASDSHIPLQLFIQPKDTLKHEPTYRYSKQIFDYLEKEIGVPYPWQVYRQIPVEDFLYGGMENTGCTLFAQDYVVDNIGFNDRNYVTVNAHELAHQWFGDLITAKSGRHHWLQEGFATYYALLAERKVFGDDYFYHQLYRNSLQLRNAAKTDTIPVMNEKASSLSFYQKGAWALHVIRESIGEKAFRKAVRNYLKKYKFQNVETSQFLSEVKKAAPAFDTESFSRTWLEDYRFPTDAANALLKENEFMRTLFEVQQLRKKTFEENTARYRELLSGQFFYPVKTEVLYQIKDIPFEQKKELLALALQSGDVKVRQSVAEFTGDIPAAFQSAYESLLDDNSYDTREIAFMNLWKNFPESRGRYLEKAKNWIGSNDRSLRIMFLTFSVENNVPDANILMDELVGYTSSKYESSVRQNAMLSVLAIAPENPEVLRNLVNATVHYKWQFSKFGRDKIRELLAAGSYRERFEGLLAGLPENEKKNLQSLLNEKK